MLIYVAQLASGGQGVTEEQLDKMRVEYGLDKPVPVQYVNWVKGVVTGDLGKSIKYHAGRRQALAAEIPADPVPGSSWP